MLISLFLFRNYSLTLRRHLYVDIVNVVCEISSRIEHSISSSPLKWLHFDSVIPVITLKRWKDCNSLRSSCQ